MLLILSWMETQILITFAIGYELLSMWNTIKILDFLLKDNKPSLAAGILTTKSSVFVVQLFWLHKCFSGELL